VSEDPCAAEEREYRDALVSLEELSKAAEQWAARDVSEYEDFPSVRQGHIGQTAKRWEPLEAARERLQAAKEALDECRKRHKSDGI